jgi:hypothetical protein
MRIDATVFVVSEPVQAVMATDLAARNSGQSFE